MTFQGPAKKQQLNGPHAHGSTARQVVHDENAEGSGQQKLRNDPCNTQHNSSTTPVRQLLGSANAKTTPARAQAAAANRT